MAASASKTLKIGDFAPDFVLKNQHGELVKFSEFRQNKAVVLYFYPKDDTPGCTMEARCFRDNYEVFRDLGAEVVGVSSDSISSHMRFADRHKLPFTLLSDSSSKVRKMYGVANTMMLIPGRVTFVIDHRGIIRSMFSSQFNAVKHIQEAIDTLKDIQREMQEAGK